MKLDDRQTSAAYGRRATAARHKHVYCIEGDHVTWQEMAARVGVSEALIRKRMGKLRKRGVPVITWALLGKSE